MTISAGESLDKGWHQQDEAFLFQLKSETVSERTVPRGQRLYAFAQDGSLAAIWTEGERVHLQDRVYARLLLVHIEPCPLIFALREVLPCSYPGKSDRFRNGLHLQVQVHAGPAETLRELEEHAVNPQKLTRRGIGEILRAKVEPVWREAAEKLCGGKPWPVDQWIAKSGELAALASPGTRAELRKAGLCTEEDALCQVMAIAPISVDNPYHG